MTLGGLSEYGKATSLPRNPAQGYAASQTRFLLRSVWSHGDGPRVVVRNPKNAWDDKRGIKVDDVHAYG